MPRRSLAILVAIHSLTVEAAAGSGFVRTEPGALELTGPRSSFGFYRAPARPPAPPPPAAALPPRAAAPDPCRAERSAYVRHLLRMAGIDEADPLALVEGLAGA